MSKIKRGGEKKEESTSDIIFKDFKGDINITGSYQIGSNNISVGGEEGTLYMKGENTKNRFKEMDLWIVKGKNSKIEYKDGVYHCDADANGGKFDINGSTFEVEKNGKWFMGLNQFATMNMDDVSAIIKTKIFRFSRGDKPMTDIGRISKSFTRINI